MPDVIIKNGCVIDGTGAKSFPADIAVENGLISDIAPSLDTSGHKTIDAAGLAVSPGFIDIHTHSDFTLLFEQKAESRVRQGITTEVTGNCGCSPAPSLSSGRDDFMELMTSLGWLFKRMSFSDKWKWETLNDLFAEVFDKGSAVNVASLVGHSTLRSNVLGYESRPPNADEMALMKRLLEIELEKGAFGLSSGLFYHPGAFADANEMTELASVVKAYNGIYATHIRSEGRYIFDAADEALTVAQKSDVSMEISHLKCETPALWGKAPLLLEKIDRMRSNGFNINFDQYPYTAYCCGLLEIFPTWAKANGTTKMIATLNDKKLRRQVITDMTDPSVDWDNAMDGLDWDQIRIMGYERPENLSLNGLTVKELAEKRSLDPLEAVLRVFSEEKGGLSMIVFALSETDLITIMQHPGCMVGSDGCSVTPYGPIGKTQLHPRYYGTFPRVLGKYVREKEVITLENAVHKMTGMPAKKLGLKKRGIIMKHKAADLVIFDPATVADRATYNNPHQYPDGIVHVLVNGEPVIQDGEHTGKLPGQMLCRE